MSIKQTQTENKHEVKQTCERRLKWPQKKTCENFLKHKTPTKKHKVKQVVHVGLLLRLREKKKGKKLSLKKNLTEDIEKSFKQQLRIF